MTDIFNTFLVKAGSCFAYLNSTEKGFVHRKIFKLILMWDE